MFLYIYFLFLWCWFLLFVFLFFIHLGFFFSSVHSKCFHQTFLNNAFSVLLSGFGFICVSFIFNFSNFSVYIIQLNEKKIRFPSHSFTPTDIYIYLDNYMCIIISLLLTFSLCIFYYFFFGFS